MTTQQVHDICVTTIVTLRKWPIPFSYTHLGKILGEDQRVSVYDALRAWTVNAAHSMFGETVKGSIREGYLADLVILSQNPLETAPDDLLDVQVVQTVVGGKTVYRA